MSNRILRMLVVVLACTAMVRAQRVFTSVNPTEDEESLRFDVNSVPVGENVVEYNDRSGQKIVDLNFSPNVAILPDSEKAFVSFSGTDQVVVFHPKTGEVLASIEVGSNPGTITLSPDATTVAVVCVFLKENLPTRDTQGALIGSIVLIDVETYQTRTLALNEVFLSVSNNVVFAKDGKQGFLPSMGSDELIRFDVETMAEISPRLQFIEGSRPAGASVVPNSGLVTVVLSGSENLSRVDTPDAIALVDPDAFEVTENIFPLTGSQYADEDGDFEILHDFTGFTNFAISADGRYGVIADQQISGISQFPELGADRAWLYDFEARVFAPPVVAGGVSAGAYYAPDGEFVVIGSLSLTFIEPEPVTADTELVSRLVNPTRVDFRAGSRPAFTHDGSLMYLASPSTDSVLVIDMATKDVLDAVDVGGPVERRITNTVGEETTTSVQQLPSGPLDLGLTPDGEIITVLNFNANNLELMKNTVSYAVPRVISTHAEEGDDESATFFTAIAISNLPTPDVEVMATAYSRGGIPFADDLNTEDIVEIENPGSLTIGGRAQAFKSVEEMLSVVSGSNGGGGGGGENQDEGDADQENETSAVDTIATGWLDLDVDRTGLAGAFFIGDRGLKRLDGSPWMGETSSRIVLPEVRYGDGMLTEVSVANPYLTRRTVHVELINDRGQLVDRFTRTLAPKGMLSDFVANPGSENLGIPVMFQDPVFEPCHSVPGDEEEDENQNEDEEDSNDVMGCGFENGYIIVTTEDSSQGDEEVKNLGVVAYEHYLELEGDRMAALRGIPIGDKASSATKFYMPQVVAFQGCSTFVKLVNPTKEWLNIDLYLKDDQGQDLVAPASLTLRSGHSTRPNIVDLFGLTDTGAFVTAWLVVEADKPGLIGDAELQLFSGKAMTSVHFMDSPSTELVFPYVPQSQLFFTGLGLVNTTNIAANITIGAVNAEGVLVHDVDMVLPPNSRVSQMLSEYASEFRGNGTAYLRVFSDQPLVGLETFFSSDYEIVASVEAQ